MARVPGVNSVAAMPAGDGLVEFSAQMEKGRDSRKELARAVVEAGWGLLELRPVGLSLEEIFLKLTTEEPVEKEPVEASEPSVEAAAS